MFIVELLRLISGYVVFRASGGFGERFLNLCAQNNIELWNVETDGDEITAAATVEDYRNIHDSARKSGMTARIIEKHGVPFFIFRHRKRIGIPVGILIFAISLSFLSSRIWLIDVDGCKTIPEETVIAAVNDAGLRVGCSRKKADAVRIALSAGEAVEEAADIRINIIGSRATVKVKERDESPEIVDFSGTYNLVASKDAQLLVLEPYRGTPRAKKFNTVLKGEVLISGVVENKDESAHFVHAAGYAVGRTDAVIKSEADINEKFYNLNVNKKRKSIFFLGIKIPLSPKYQKSGYEYIKEKYLSFSGKRMPFGIIEAEYISTSPASTQPDGRQRELIAIERYLQNACDYAKPRQVISETVSEDFAGENKSVSGMFTCYENIGEEKEFKLYEE